MSSAPEDAFEDSAIDGLRVDVSAATSADDVVNVGLTVEQFESQRRERHIKSDGLSHKIRKAERRRLIQQRRHREWFFWWALGSITVVIVASGTFFAWHMNSTSGKPSDAVMIGWLTTTLVEVVGLGYIIAHSLFQSKNGDSIRGRSAHIPRPNRPSA